MTLRLDVLKDNEMCVIYDSVNSNVESFWCGDSFITAFNRLGKDQDLVNYFGGSEIQDFFKENDLVIGQKLAYLIMGTFEYDEYMMELKEDEQLELAEDLRKGI